MKSRGTSVLGDIVIDFDRMELHCGDHLIPATSLEFRLLRLFVDNPKHVFTRKELIKAAWTKRQRATLRSVDTYIRLLRMKFEKDPASPLFFQTIHGTGYKYVPPEGSQIYLDRAAESIEPSQAAAENFSNSNAVSGMSIKCAA